MKNIKLVLTFGVFGVIPSYLVIILLKICVFGKIKSFHVKYFFRPKISDLDKKYHFSSAISSVKNNGVTLIFQKVDVVLPENPYISELRRSWADLRSMGQTLIHARSTLEQFLGQSGRAKCPN